MAWNEILAGAAARNKRAAQERGDKAAADKFANDVSFYQKMKDVTPDTLNQLPELNFVPFWTPTQQETDYIENPGIPKKSDFEKNNRQNDFNKRYEELYGKPEKQTKSASMFDGDQSTDFDYRDIFAVDDGLDHNDGRPQYESVDSSSSAYDKATAPTMMGTRKMQYADDGLYDGFEDVDPYNIDPAAVYDKNINYIPDSDSFINDFLQSGINSGVQKLQGKLANLRDALTQYDVKTDDYGNINMSELDDNFSSYDKNIGWRRKYKPETLTRDYYDKIGRSYTGYREVQILTDTEGNEHDVNRLADGSYDTKFTAITPTLAIAESPYESYYVEVDENTQEPVNVKSDIRRTTPDEASLYDENTVEYLPDYLFKSGKNVPYDVVRGLYEIPYSERNKTSASGPWIPFLSDELSTPITSLSDGYIFGGDDGIDLSNIPAKTIDMILGSADLWTTPTAAATSLTSPVMSLNGISPRSYNPKNDTFFAMDIGQDEDSGMYYNDRTNLDKMYSNAAVSLGLPYLERLAGVGKKPIEGVDQIVNNAAKKFGLDELFVNNPIIRTIYQMITKGVGEGAEEVLGNIYEEIMNEGTNGAFASRDPNTGEIVLDDDFVKEFTKRSANFLFDIDPESAEILGLNRDNLDAGAAGMGMSLALDTFIPGHGFIKKVKNNKNYMQKYQQQKKEESQTRKDFMKMFAEADKKKYESE